MKITHDKIARAMTSGTYDGKYLWSKAKVYVQEMANSANIVTLTFDDSIQEKKYPDESELICWHFDYTVSRSLKGINLMKGMLGTSGMLIPVAVDFVRKGQWAIDPKTGKKKRKSGITKNQMMRDMFCECSSKMHFDYVLADSWYSWVENMLCCQTIKRDFIMAIKGNRLATLSRQNKEFNKYVRIEELQLGQQSVDVWLKRLGFLLQLTKQVFKNRNDAVGGLYLVCSDLGIQCDQINTIYQRRWGVEEFHKSLKSNLGFAKSPTKKIKTQTNHYVLSIVAYIKMEVLKQRTNMNHYTLKYQLYQGAQRAAYEELKKISTKRVVQNMVLKLFAHKVSC